MELAIDTSTRYASVAVSDEGKLVVELSWRSEQNHSVELVPALKEVLRRAAVLAGQVEAVFVARGPGGFSALRVGISVAKAFAAAQEVPLVSVGTLEVEAHPYLGAGIPVCAVIQAGRESVYAARYDDSGVKGNEADHRVVSYDGLLEVVGGQKTLFCGEGLSAVSHVLREGQRDLALLASAPPPTRRPSVIAQLGFQRLQAGETDDPHTLQPLYMRGSQFEVAQRARRL